MESALNKTLTRRQLERLGLLAGGAAGMAALGHAAGRTAIAQEATPGPILAPTPACGDDDDLDLTAEQTEGPFYTPQTPERTSLLEPGMPGTTFLLSGYVYSVDCRPVEKALIDFWHADDAGVYDNEGFRLRGHQFTDDEGRYELETILPGLYTGRTRHIHVKVQAPDQPVLTTQLYFPDEPANESDGIFDPDLLVEYAEPDEDAAPDDAEAEEQPLTAFFTFVLDIDD